MGTATGVLRSQRFLRSAGLRRRPRGRSVQLLVPVLVLCLVSGIDLGLASPVSAATAVNLYVATAGTSATCTSAGTGACPTLQDAINAAEGAAYDGDDVTIEVKPGTYTENGSIDAQDLGSLTIAGAGSATTTLESHNSSAVVLDITFGTVTISGVTITAGDAEGSGGIQSLDATLSLTNDVFSDDAVTENGETGGAVDNSEGTLVATDDRFTDDSAEADGGAIYSFFASVTISDDTFTQDSTQGSGGAVDSGSYDTATLSDDTFYQDSAFYGGGVASSGTATLTNDTFLQGGGYGSGFANESGTAQLVNDTLEDSLWTYSTGGTTVSDSIVIGTCNMPITDGGYNINGVINQSCGFGPTSRLPHRAVDASYALARNGVGFPKTLALGPNSPAIGEVPASACTVTTDERGRPRPGISGQTSCDAGSYELQHTPITLVQNAKTSVTVKAGQRYVGQLETTHASGDVSYTVTAPSPHVTVSRGGLLRVPASTPPGTYTVSGTDRDPVDDSGHWRFTATVKRVPR